MEQTVVTLADEQMQIITDHLVYLENLSLICVIGLGVAAGILIALVVGRWLHGR